MTTAINDALSFAGDKYIPPGTYLISATLTPVSGSRLSGPGIIKLKASTNVAMLTCASLSRIQIDGLTFDGNQANQVTPIASTQGGLRFTACSDIAINNCKIVEVSRRPIYATNCSDFIIDGCEIDGGKGASGVSSSTVIFDTGSGQESTRIRVINNKISRNETAPLWAVVQFRGFAANDGLCNKVVFSGNTVTLNDDIGHVNAVGIEFGNGCADFVCSGNHFYGGSIGISCAAANNGTVSGNRIKMGSTTSLGIAAGGHQGIELTASGDISVTGNVIDGQTKLAKGISLAAGTTYGGISITGNTIKDCNPTAGYAGVYSSTVNDVTIQGNTIQGAGYYGVYIQTGDSLSVTGNTITGTSRYGVYLKDCNDAVVTGNSVVSTLAASDGIAAFVSNGVTFDGLHIEANRTNTVAQSVITNISGTGAYTNNYIVTTGTGTLASGTNQVGTTVRGTAPSAGGTIGWVCTTAGAPGTWKTP
jgi:parallel beta-helix repeat protein